MSVLVYAPASMANISVGFDTLGAALSPINGELLGDRVQVQASETNTLEISCVGPFADRLPKDPKLNIIYDCYHRFAQKLEQDMQMVMPPVTMTLEKNMPIGSGLGSSACSVVGGFYALNAYMDNPFDEQQLLLLMGELEGQISGSVHYDNVAPCYLGGMQLMLQQDQLISQAIPHFEDWYWVLCYPGINISTAEARSILPAQYRRQDVLSYGRQLAGFVHASYSQQPELAAALLKDVIAEPYRAPLIPGFNQARQYALEQGALAMGISGSGPTVFVACQSQAKAEKIQTWLNQEFIQGPDGFSHLCQIDGLGARKVGTSL